MRDLDDIHAERPDQGFQFPGAFEVTAIGLADGGIEHKVAEIVSGLGLAVVADSQRTRPSREGHYLSVSITFTCPDREHYDAVHAALREDPAIRWTL